MIWTEQTLVDLGEKVVPRQTGVAGAIQGVGVAGVDITAGHLQDAQVVDQGVVGCAAAAVNSRTVYAVHGAAVFGVAAVLAL